MSQRTAGFGVSAVCLSLVMWTVACSDEERGHRAGGQTPDGSAADAGGAIAGAGGSDAGGEMGAVGDADDGAPTWSGIYTYEFTTCSIDFCHGEAARRAGLDFTSKEAAWHSLVDRPANPDSDCGAFGKLRVVPFQPDESLLYLKLSIHSPCGSQMPPGGELLPAARDRVRAWIELGAKND